MSRPAPSVIGWDDESVYCQVFLQLLKHDHSSMRHTVGSAVVCGPDRDAGAMAYPRCGHCAGLFKGGSLTATCPLHPECTIGLMHHNCVRPHTELFHRDEDKSPSPDDGRFPRNRAPPVDPEAALRAASSAPSSSSATPPAASALSPKYPRWSRLGVVASSHRGCIRRRRLLTIEPPRAQRHRMGR